MTRDHTKHKTFKELIHEFQTKTSGCDSDKDPDKYGRALSELALGGEALIRILVRRGVPPRDILASIGPLNEAVLQAADQLGIGKRRHVGNDRTTT